MAYLHEAIRWLITMLIRTLPERDNFSEAFMVRTLEDNGYVVFRGRRHVRKEKNGQPSLFGVHKN